MAKSRKPRLVYLEEKYKAFDNGTSIKNWRINLLMQLAAENETPDGEYSDDEMSLYDIFRYYHKYWDQIYEKCAMEATLVMSEHDKDGAE